MRARVTLTTDFGTRDPYVAQLKGVLYARGPDDLEVVDLTHEIEAQNVREAALFLRTAWPQFPPGTIHLVVVDPGVGSARRAVAVEAAGQRMLAPDNGVLSWLLDAVAGEAQAIEIDPARLGVATLSSTFHGRDLFAPAAARLAHGAALETLGARVTGLMRLPQPQAQRGPRGWQGEIIHVDRFGNLITNLSRAELAEALQRNQQAIIRLGNGAPLPLVRWYAEAPAGIAVVLIGSSELLEIAVRDASAQALTGARVGDKVSLESA
jgi:S-adenosylmethionine hydrolase